MFQVKAKKIYLSSHYWMGLFDIYKRGPFKSNENIELIAMPAFLDVDCYLEDHKWLNRENWVEESLPRFRKSMEYLSQINDKFELSLKCKRLTQWNAEVSRQFLLTPCKKLKNNFKFLDRRWSDPKAQWLYLYFKITNWLCRGVKNEIQYLYDLYNTSRFCKFH